MNINKTQEGSKLTVALEGRLDTVTAPQLEGDLRSSVNGVTELVLLVGSELLEIRGILVEERRYDRVRLFAFRR